MTLTEFLEARIAEDEAAARTCAEMFPPPWAASDRGWRVRIYASEVPIPDLSSDDEGAMTVRDPVVMEVEPDRHINDPKWLSERVAHVIRHDPARVLAECEAKRMMLELHSPHVDMGYGLPCRELTVLALPYADHPDYRPEWRP